MNRPSCSWRSTTREHLTVEMALAIIRLFTEGYASILR